MIYRISAGIGLRIYDLLIEVNSLNDIPKFLERYPFFENPDNKQVALFDAEELDAAQVKELLPPGTPITSVHDWEIIRQKERRQRYKKSEQRRANICKIK